MCSCRLKGSREPYRRICITAREMCALPLPEHIEHLVAGGCIDAVILRDKASDEIAYEKLAREMLAVCGRLQVECIAHTFIGAAQRVGCRSIHVPLDLLRETGRPAGMVRVGTGIHSLEQIAEAQQLGADYLIASHIFETECKSGQPGRGLEFLHEAVLRASVPVYALGGITDINELQVIDAGADGACRMSDYMKRSFVLS
ncbi:MAG: thiamine phosphate synthase [Raoultibacter sp.]